MLGGCLVGLVCSVVDGVVECVIVVDAGHGDTYVVATHKLASFQS